LTVANIRRFGVIAVKESSILDVTLCKVARAKYPPYCRLDLGVAVWGRSVERSGGLALISAAGQRAGLAFERRASLPGLAAAWLIRVATLTDL
jgi:hypothetical protein